MALLFFGLTYLAIRFGNLDNLKPETRLDKILMFVGIFIMLHIILFIHELGHLITGLVQGFRFDLFVVGLLGVKREEDGIKCYLNKDLNYYGGVAATSPKGNEEANAKKFAFILLAGPIASIVFAIICLFSASHFPPPYGISIFIGGIMSLAIFLATTVPEKTGMFFTDRKRFQRLVSPGKDQKVELALLRIMGQYAQDHSYQNIELSDIDLLISDETPFIRSSGLFNKICWQIEHHGVEDDETKVRYHEQAQSMPKKVAELLEKEIEKYRAKFSDSNYD